MAPTPSPLSSIAKAKSALQKMATAKPAEIDEHLLLARPCKTCRPELFEAIVVHDVARVSDQRSRDQDDHFHDWTAARNN